LASIKPPPPQTNQYADIEWRGNVPYSKYFGDVYYSTADGYQASHYHFQQQTSLSTRWKKLKPQQTFTIIETGFGTGLNFFTTWRNWQENAKKDTHLFYISTELHPLKPEQIQQAIFHWPELRSLLDQFLSQYPAPTQGFHQRQFKSDKLTLLLLYGDATESLSELTHPADTWFLDGFDPKKNPQLWSNNLFCQIERLSKPNTNLATCTSNTEVQNKLISHHFQITKKPGFEKKTAMLVATFQSATPSLTQPIQKKPWFTNKDQSQVKQKYATIIGAGIAGMCSAAALAQRGWQVTILEKNQHVAQEGSGNPWGALYTRFNTHKSPVNQFFQSSFSYTTDYMKALHEQTPDQTFWDPCGLFQCAFSDKEEQQFQTMDNNGFWPKSLLNYLTAEQASDLTGISIDRPGLWIPRSGRVSPRAFCQHLLDLHPNIQLHCNQEVSDLIQTVKDGEPSWQLNDLNGKLILESPVVIIANAQSAKNFSPTQYLPTSQIRGQLSFVPSTQASRKLSTIVSYEGYILPADPVPNEPSRHLMGATFHPKDVAPNLRAEDHQQNLHQLAQISAELAAQLESNTPLESLGGRVAFRCQSADYLPIVGPIPVMDQFKQDYAGLRAGKLKIDYPPGAYLPGLYCNVAHGSKGLISAPISAEVIAAHIENTPQPLPSNLIQAIHPARFVIRGLKRGQY